MTYSNRMKDFEPRKIRKPNRKERRNSASEHLTFTPKEYSNQYNLSISARTSNQRTFLSLLQDDSQCIVIGEGCAGCGKTYLATQVAAKMLIDNKVKGLVIVRPAVAADGEKHGFLPGNLEEKLDPWLQPVLRVLAKVYHPTELEYMRKIKIIDVAALAYLRGITFEDCIVIFDEAQNASVEQMKMLLTRIGENARIYITGDVKQSDLKGKQNGLEHLLKGLSSNPSDNIGVCQFSHEDIQRHFLIDHILKVYNADDIPTVKKKWD